MPLSVNSNIAALNAQRNLEKSTSALSKSLERLSSGLRINRAGDDAAGLAISESLRSQVRGLNQAIRNSNDAISLIGTAEGAIDAYTNILQRIRELSVQAANDTNSASNRAAIQSEVDQQLTELSRIANTVQFNGLNLLDGSFENKLIQAGAFQNQTISISIDDLRAQSIGAVASVDSARVGSMSDGDLVINGAQVGGTLSDGVSFSNSNGSAISVAKAINAAIGNTQVSAEANHTLLTGGSLNFTSGVVDGLTPSELILNGEAIGASLAGSDTLSNFSNATSAIAVAAAINNNNSVHGVTATANEAVVAFDDNGVVQAVNLTSNGNVLEINGIRVSVDLTPFTPGENAAQALATAINNTATLGAASGGFVTASTDASGHLVLTGTDGRNIDVQTHGAATTANTAQVNGLGSLGELTLNGTQIAASIAGNDPSSTVLKANSAIAVAAAVNASLGTTGVSATAGPTAVSMTVGSAADYTTGTGDFTLSINGSANINVDLNAGTAAGRAAQLKAAIDGLSIAGITTQVSGSNLIVTAADGRNVDLVTTGTDGGGVTGAEALGFGVGEQFAGNSLTDGTFTGAVSLSSASAITIGGTSTEFTNGTTAVNATSTGAIGTALGLSAGADLAQTAYHGSVTLASDETFVIAGTDAAFAPQTVTTTGIQDVILDGLSNSLTINGVNIGTVTVLANDASGSLVEAINAFSNQTGVAAHVNGQNQLVLDAADGRNITLTTTGETGFALGLTLGPGSNLTSNTTTGTVTLFGAKAFSLAGTATGFPPQSVAIDFDSAITNIKVTTAEAAAEAIRTVDFALQQINSSRADLGAITNRLEVTIGNLRVISENLSASDSRIRDADFATETAELTKNQILQQAGVAILAQANVSPQAALSLLQ